MESGGSHPLKNRLGVSAPSADMSEDDLRHCMQAFRQLQDQEERLPIQLLHEAFQLLGLREPGVEELQRSYSEQGVTGLEFLDFAQLACSRRGGGRRRDTRAMLLTIFGFIDHDKDGFITCTELKEVLSVLGQISSDETVEKMISRLGSDGRVSFEQFERMVDEEAERDG